MPFIIQKTVYGISCLLKNSLLKLLCCTKTFFKRCENEITLFIRRIFPFLRWKVFHKSAFSVFFFKKPKKPLTSRSKVCSRAIIDFSVRKVLWFLSQLSTCCIFQRSYLFLEIFSLYKKLEKTWKWVLRLKSRFCVKLFVGDIIWKNLMLQITWLYYSLL